MSECQRCQRYLKPAEIYAGYCVQCQVEIAAEKAKERREKALQEAMRRVR